MAIKRAKDQTQVLTAFEILNKMLAYNPDEFITTADKKLELKSQIQIKQLLEEKFVPACINSGWNNKKIQNAIETEFGYKISLSMIKNIRASINKEKNEQQSNPCKQEQAVQPQTGPSV